MFLARRSAAAVGLGATLGLIGTPLWAQARLLEDRPEPSPTEAAAPPNPILKPQEATTASPPHEVIIAGPADEVAEGESPAPEIFLQEEDMNERSFLQNVDGGAAPGLWDAPQEGSKPAFIKGDLIHPGTRRMLSRFDHVGVSMGPYIIDNSVYLNVTPGAAFYFKDFALSLGLPLNLLAFDGLNRSYGGMRIRRQDWDEVADFAKIIRFFTIGRKEYNLYFTVNSLRPSTLGHGQIIDKYQGNIDVDRSMTGLMFDAYNDYGGFQMQMNDITFQNRVVGALAFIKPLSFFMDDDLAKSLSIGLEYAGDLNAPRCIRRGPDSPECVAGRGHAAGNNPYTGESLDRTFVRSDPTTGRFVSENTIVHAAGTSVELKVYKDEDSIDIKTYGTYHHFLNEGGGGGMAVGVLGRFNAGTKWVSAIRARAEYRNFGDGFLPAYFNSLYEVKKFGYQSSGDYQTQPTQYQAVFGDPAHGFDRQNIGRRHGYNLEASWGLFQGSRGGKKVSFGVGLQDSTGPNDTQFYTHLEFPLLGFLQVFGTFMKTNEQSLGEVFGKNMFTSQNTVVLSGLRLQILPILFLNAHYSRNFQVVRSPGSEFHLGNERVVDAGGNVSQFFQEDRLFENVQTLFVELEFGWEF